jgi:histidyl-tRNA synthetase
VLRILDSKEDATHPAVLAAPSILDHLEPDDAQHFAEVRALLDALGVAYEVDPRIVRGLDYYARTVWEFEPRSDEGGGGGQSTVGAGGRYDGLIELLGGPHTPGTGFATGIERIMLNLREREQALAPGVERMGSPRVLLAMADPPVDVYTAPLGAAGHVATLRLARELRAAGFAVRLGLPGRGLRAHFRAAESASARYIAIIGDDEAARGVVQLKALAGDGEQREVALDAAIKVVRGAA